MPLSNAARAEVRRTGQSAFRSQGSARRTRVSSGELYLPSGSDVSLLSASRDSWLRLSLFSTANE